MTFYRKHLITFFSVLALFGFSSAIASAKTSPLATPVATEQQSAQPQAQAAGIWGKIKLIFNIGKTAVKVILRGISAVIHSGEEVLNSAGKLMGFISDGSSLGQAAQEAHQVGCHSYHNKLICPRPIHHLARTRRAA